MTRRLYLRYFVAKHKIFKNKSGQPESVVADVNKMARHRTRTDTIPLIEEEGGIPAKPKKKPLWKPTPGDNWDPDLPYGGKVYLARKLKDDPTWIKMGEVHKTGNLK